MNWYVLRASVNREDRYIACEERSLESLPEFWELCGPVFPAADEAESYIKELRSNVPKNVVSTAPRTKLTSEQEKRVAEALERASRSTWREQDQDEFETRLHYAVQQRSKKAP